MSTSIGGYAYGDWQKIMTKDVASASSITFDNIPSGYSDFMIIGWVQVANGTFLRINGDTSGYGWNIIQADGTNVITQRDTSDSEVNMIIGNSSAYAFLKAEIHTSINNTKVLSGCISNGTYQNIFGGHYNGLTTITQLSLHNTGAVQWHCVLYGCK